METVLSSLARWLVVFALMLSYWPFGRAHASVSPSPSAPATQPWRAPAIVSFEKALYSANFEWASAVYQFEIGTRKYERADVGKSRFVAVITKNGARVATCERQLRGETVFTTQSLLMRCSGKMFDPSSGYVRFEFGPYPAPPGLMVWSGPRVPGRHVALQPLKGSAPQIVAKSK